MNPETNQYISDLLNNFIESQPDVVGAFLYSKSGEFLLKYENSEFAKQEKLKTETGKDTTSILMEGLVNKLVNEFKEDIYGSGSFDIPDYRVIYLESGTQSLLIFVCDFLVNMDKLIPFAYIAAEKVAQLVEGSFNFKNSSLKIPNLKIPQNFRLDLDKHSIESAEPLFDHVYPKHLFKREEVMKRYFKIIVVGAESVGKTTLINSFLRKKQTADYRPTIGLAISTQTYSIQGFEDNTISFLIYDLAGQKFFNRARLEYYTGANYAVIVYDITRKDTFENAVKFWYNDIRKRLGEIPIIFIGNKVDLENTREVSNSEGEQKAHDLNCDFIETSALENLNVNDTFNIIGIKLFLKSFPEKQKDLKV